MLKYLKKAAPALLSSVIALTSTALTSTITGCTYSYIGNPNPTIRTAPNPFPKITDDSEIGRYFLSEDDQRNLDDTGFMSELEERVEYSASKVFERNISIATPIYTEAGYRVLLSNFGELEIIDETPIPFWELTEEQREGIEHNAERFGTSQLLYKKQPGKPKYAAYVSELGGFAFSLLFTHIIIFDNDKRSFRGVVSTLYHEGQHHFIEQAEDYPMLPVILRPEERMAIVESACAFMEGPVAEQFQKDHLIPGSKLYQQFTESKELEEIAQVVWPKAVDWYESIPEEKRISDRPGILKTLSDYLSKHLKHPIKVNEARLAIAKRYGGGEERFRLMRDIFNMVGATKFISLAGCIENDKQLKKARNAVMLGARNIEAMCDDFMEEEGVIIRPDHILK